MSTIPPLTHTLWTVSRVQKATFHFYFLEVNEFFKKFVNLTAELLFDIFQAMHEKTDKSIIANSINEKEVKKCD